MIKFTKHFIFVAIMLISSLAWAQSGKISGRVFDKKNNESIPFATVVIQGTSNGVTTDIDGKYALTGLKGGLYNLEVSYIGFKKKVVFEVEVTPARPAIANIGLEEETTKLETVTVTASSSFLKTTESPVSLRTIGTNEIKRNPGGNRDISKVIRTLPGVAAVPAFRNDVIVRGGAPNENRFFLDGIEVPNINHFATQGSSGGPVGLINVDFIREVEFYSGAFPANRGNALSSVLEFKQKDGRTDRWTANGIVSATDVGITLEGPVTKNSSVILSARRSYLQFLFAALELPFLPTYNDFQLKYKHKFGKKSQLSIIGLGAIDQFRLNLDANDTEEQRYTLNNLPVTEQWNYTIGAKYDWFRENGSYSLIVSRNALNNNLYKHPGNDESLPRILDYKSREIENKFRLEDYIEAGGWKLNLSLQYELAQYTNSTDNQVVIPNSAPITKSVQSELDINKWGASVQVSRSFFEDKLALSLGLRADANDYSEEMSNLANQLSPRFSASYSFTPTFSWNFNTGIYYQLPAYTILGYKEGDTFVNKANDIKYIKNSQLVTGFEYNLPASNTRITVEGFYKFYENYPFLIREQISLANLGADFGVIGNDPVNSSSVGRAYGLELLVQRKFSKGIYGILAYTLVRSEFKDRNDEFVASAWDNRHILSLTGGYKFGNNWEFGTRILFSGGAPFTPFDLNATLTPANWDIAGQGIPDYTRLNTERNSAFYQVDVRLDKKWFFKKWSLNVFFDIQNVTNAQVQFQDNIDVVRDDQGNPVRDPNNPNLYQGKFLDNIAGNVLPSIGIIVEL
ncbi:TonB-dependent receptor [Microscilla marina]|uniref:Putative ferric aerobactin receptor n=1 Tax=Microscilla marina ATCC 23134 TaxID=313606 RepID=A1ZUF1_MICM2|nr:TonB-dependent receptor [Microscilla marina]EAY25970.1 putative ferric aerobactin receptor [Microscilla marina ATCC 23134]